MMKELNYEIYLDKVYGGWLGKCLGGAMGDRFEGTKSWIDIPVSDMLPDELPPNDDFDLQALWLKVLEEKGPNFTSVDLADAFIKDCWYPFNEYGVFRRNYKIGITPPASGSFANQFWETGMGCAIRAEIWGYIYPGEPNRAAECAGRDGVLDHTEEAVNGEKMLAAVMADAFFESDPILLIKRHIGFLEPKCVTRLNIETAIEAHKEGLSLKDAFLRVCFSGGVTEACDAQINIPIIILGLLYGEGDMEKTLHATLSCGYDCDSTMATAGSIIGQIIGANAIPDHLRNYVGDRLVMDIAYRRPEMTISALARDTARIGYLFSDNGFFIDAPEMDRTPYWSNTFEEISVSYESLPVVAPGETVRIRAGLKEESRSIKILAPEGWDVTTVGNGIFDLKAPINVEVWPDHHSFTVKTEDGKYSKRFGLSGAAIWRVIDIIQEPEPPYPEDEFQPTRRLNISHVDPNKKYHDEPLIETDSLYKKNSKILGKPFFIVSRENEIEPEDLVGLGGSFIAYLDRTVIAQSDQNAFISIGHTEPFRLFLNGSLVAESSEAMPWAPYNKNAAVKLRKGENHFILKYVKRSDKARMTFAIRERNVTNGERRNLNSPNHQDLMIGLADKVNI